MSSLPEGQPRSGEAVEVPFLDLRGSFEAIRDDVLADLSRSLSSGAFTNGPAVREFEEAFAAYCEVADCVGLASGLDALRLALQALDVGPGDEVLVPAMTFIATWEAVSQLGATPVPVDVTTVDYGIDLEAADAAVGARTRAVVPVHLYGQMVDPEACRRFTSARGLAIVEDACQAHGAERRGVRAGSFGAAAAFSFYPTKNLGAMGDAGALVTSDLELASRARALREHGQRRKNEHSWIGWTARLDTIQAAALLRKLPLLDSWNEGRRTAAARYEQALAGVGDLVLPPVAADSQPAWHVYVVMTRDPAGLANYLSERRIQTGRHYPEPIHLGEAYRALGYQRGAFPVAERLARECLSLPMFPGMTESHVEAVVRGIESWFASGR